MPGVYYLRHVGFLGAQPPAIKGLRPIELAEGEPGVIEFSEGALQTTFCAAALEAENKRLPYRYKPLVEGSLVHGMRAERFLTRGGTAYTRGL